MTYRSFGSISAYSVTAIILALISRSRLRAHTVHLMRASSSPRSRDKARRSLCSQHQSASPAHSHLSTSHLQIWNPVRRCIQVLERQADARATRGPGWQCRLGAPDPRYVFSPVKNPRRGRVYSASAPCVQRERDVVVVGRACLTLHLSRSALSHASGAPGSSRAAVLFRRGGTRRLSGAQSSPGDRTARTYGSRSRLTAHFSRGEPAIMLQVCALGVLERFVY